MYSQNISPKSLFAAATMALLLAACGGQSNSASSAAAAPAATQAQAVPTATQAQAEATATKSGDTSAPTVAPTAAAVASVTKINLNTATAEQILTVPNAGNRMVREFQEYRPYASIAEFRKAIGKYVDAAQISDYEKYVYVPVSPNNADAATLQQLPGVDQARAEQLIAARPYADKSAFLKKLGELTSADQATSATAMVEEQ